jgi:hypothetical protein
VVAETVVVWVWRYDDVLVLSENIPFIKNWCVGIQTVVDDG